MYFAAHLSFVYLWRYFVIILTSMQKRKIIEMVLKILFGVFLANIGITVTIDRFSNPKLTETELILRVPQTFFWDFKVNPY